mmetsp:Transcript_30498/g.76329  ORF Transcript_30498/g.76329 Transcript_30498/m.76329 type:complete len:263 (-) Transcript_30498:1147-1935(-)
MLCPTMTSASSWYRRARRTWSSARSDGTEDSTVDLVRSATGCTWFSFVTTWFQPGGMVTPSRARTTLKWRTLVADAALADVGLHASVGVGWSTRTSRMYTIDAEAISLTLARWFTTVLRLSAATVSAGASRVTPLLAGGRTDLCPPVMFTSSLHQLCCWPLDIREAPCRAIHEGPMMRDLTMRCSSMGAWVPRMVTKCRPLSSLGSAGEAAGQRTLMTYCTPRGISSRSKQYERFTGFMVNCSIPRDRSISRISSLTSAARA